VAARDDALDPETVRRRFGARLVGAGIEIGPGHVPFPVPAGVTVRYVDRWRPEDNRSLFPELGEAPGFPVPDVLADLDADRLSAFADESQDFVIASHVLEHLANPLAMLVDIHRVLRPGGLLVLLLPDRHRTFDRQRPPTPLLHLVDEYRHDVRVVDDEHIVEFMLATNALTAEVTADTADVRAFYSEEMAAHIELHRQRSIHVHVWDRGEFEQVMRYANEVLDLRWRVLDTMAPGEPGTYDNEFGWLLARRAGALRARLRRGGRGAATA
jgi:SAM-dependent methyltransferase